MLTIQNPFVSVSQNDRKIKIHSHALHKQNHRTIVNIFINQGYKSHLLSLSNKKYSWCFCVLFWFCLDRWSNPDTYAKNLQAPNHSKTRQSLNSVHTMRCAITNINVKIWRIFTCPTYKLLLSCMAFQMFTVRLFQIKTTFTKFGHTQRIPQLLVWHFVFRNYFVFISTYESVYYMLYIRNILHCSLHR